MQRKASTAIFLNQRECWAAHQCWIDTEAQRHAAHERRLAGAEITGQENEIADRQRLRELAADRGGFLFRMCRPGQLLSTTLRRAVSSSMASPRCPTTSAAVMEISPSSAAARSPAIPWRYTAILHAA